MLSVSLRFCARRRSATPSSSSESSRRSRAKSLSRISSKNRGLCPMLLSDWTLPAEEACADVVPTRSSKMVASRFSSSVSRCSCIALLRSGEKASQKSLPQRLNHGNDQAVSDNDRPGGHRIHKIQNSSSDLLPIATGETDLQLAGTRSSGRGVRYIRSRLERL